MIKYVSITIITFLVSAQFVAAAVFTRDLTLGLKNDPEVKQLQLLLAREKLYSGPINGYYAGMLRASVIKFQSKYNINPTGYFGPMTRARAELLVSKKVTSVKTQEALPLSSSTNPVLLPASAITGNLGFGIEGSAEVKLLQLFLSDAGFYDGPVTGNFFTLTKDAVKRFQLKHGIETTGFVGPLTRERISAVSLQRQIITKQKDNTSSSSSSASSVGMGNSGVGSGGSNGNAGGGGSGNSGGGSGGSSSGGGGGGGSTVPSPTISSVSLTPTSATVNTSGTHQFAVSVLGTGAYSTAVTWSAQRGSITAAGLYTAPGTSGSDVVTVRSTQNTSKFATANITVNTPVITPTITTVSLNPTSATVNTGATAQFTPQVLGTGTFSTAVTWSAQRGSITSAGLYTAPSTSGSDVVTIRSTQNTSKFATANITVNAPVVTPTISSVTLTPTSATVNTSGTHQFAVSVLGTGAYSTAVTWSAQRGSITATGLYTAPSTSGSDVVTVRSSQDTSKYATAAVTVNAIPVLTPGWLIPPTPLVKLSQPVQSLPASMGQVENIFGDVVTTVTKRISDSQPEYATSQLWNADMSLVRLNRGVVLNANTFAPSSYSLAGCGGDHRTWSSIDPDICYGSGEGGRWVKKNVKTNTVYYSTPSGWTTTNTTRSYVPFGTDYVFAMNGEGENLDSYDSAAALMGNNKTSVQVIDPKTGNPKCSVTGLSGIDNARVSQDGKHVIIQSPSGLDAYSVSSSGACPFVRSLFGQGKGTGHWDACVDTNGESVAVTEEGLMSRVRDGHISTVWAASPRVPRQTHVSCTNRNRPGFAYYGDQSSDALVVNSDFYNRCWAVKLDPAVNYVAGTTLVENWLWQHHKVPAVVSGESALCAPSPDGRFVMFASRWNGTDSMIRSFVSYVLPGGN